MFLEKWYTTICLLHLTSHFSLSLILSFLSLPYFSAPSQRSWKLNTVIFPPTVPFSAHLGVNLHIFQINISEVSGEYAEPLQRSPPTPSPSALLVFAGVLFCLPELVLMALFFFFRSACHMLKNIWPSSDANVLRSFFQLFLKFSFFSFPLHNTLSCRWINKGQVNRVASCW